MRNNKDELKEWADRMERGEQEDDLLMIAARLEQLENGGLPSVEFQRQLRRDLLNEFPAAMHPPRQLWQRVGSLAALGLLAAFVFAIWMSISSAGRNTTGGVPLDGAPLATATIGITTPSLSSYTFLDYSVSSGNIEDMILVEVSTSWSAPVDKQEQPVFALHLLGSEGQIIAQSDAVVPSGGEMTSQLNIPADLASGDYTLEGILYDPASGERLMFYSPDGEVLSAFRSRFKYGSGAGLYDGEEFSIIGWNVPQDNTFQTQDVGDMLIVRDVTPAGGTIISGTSPIDFTVTVDYVLGSLLEATLEVRVTDLQGESGRGVGLAVREIYQGTGGATLVISVDPAELPNATDLGLWLQIKPDGSSTPIAIDMPEEYRWRYEP